MKLIDDLLILAAVVMSGGYWLMGAFATPLPPHFVILPIILTLSAILFERRIINESVMKLSGSLTGLEAQSTDQRQVLKSLIDEMLEIQARQHPLSAQHRSDRR